MISAIDCCLCLSRCTCRRMTPPPLMITRKTDSPLLRLPRRRCPWLRVSAPTATATVGTAIVGTAIAGIGQAMESSTAIRSCALWGAGHVRRRWVY